MGDQTITGQILEAWPIGNSEEPRYANHEKQFTLPVLLRLPFVGGTGGQWSVSVTHTLSPVTAWKECHCAPTTSVSDRVTSYLQSSDAASVTTALIDTCI
jgi:hypothetical protein